ncbi:MAG: MerR family transcriptional regulator [Bacteroidia bacterium]
MSKEYDISVLEKLTDIKAHTIRIWEQRYKLLNPERTSTNIRVYKDKDLQKLLNVKLLLDYGYKISEVAGMSDEKIKNTITNILKTNGSSGHFMIEYFINELLIATEELDELNFERTYLNAINKYGLYKTMKDVIYPLMRKIGIMWSLGDISPLQEHFASQIIIRKIQSAIDALELVYYSKTSYALFLFPEEYHQIPLLFANYILRSHKKKTYYLGEDVPIENISTLTKDKKIDYLVSFITSNLDKKNIAAIERLIKHLPDDTSLIIGTSKENANNIQKHIHSKKIIYTSSMEEFIRII